MTTGLRFFGWARPKEMRDPGNGGRLAPDTQNAVRIYTAGAETRLLSNPEFLGQFMLITFQEDGGDCVITAGGTINQAGNNTITLNDVGDSVLLVGRSAGGAAVPILRWTVVVNDGAALSTI